MIRIEALVPCIYRFNLILDLKIVTVEKGTAREESFLG